MELLILIAFCLLVICILLMRTVLKQEITIFNLNEKLAISDQEYIDLFNENLLLSGSYDDLEVSSKFKND